MNDVKSMSEDMVLEVAVKEARRLGCEIIKMRKLKHEADYYLRYVLAYSEEKEEYVTWMLNVQFGGLGNGHYFYHHKFSQNTKEEAYEQALEDFKTR
jgi:hypothetical protein